MRIRGAVVAMALTIALGACSSGAADSKGARQPSAPSASVSASASRSETRRRIPLTRALLEEHSLTSEDIALLQLYVRSAVILRRELTEGTREVTPQHTLRIVDGRSYDEVLLADGTPGIGIRTTPQGVFVNFDPEAPESGFAFESATDDHFRLKVEHDAGGQGPSASYEGETYRVVQGASAYLEIDAEKLQELTKRQRKLPGALLPDPSATSEPDAGA
ncbi:MAG: hypothetical protein HY908_27870, partial [Myxococcales bacterium]|nr:hypothetical protein [Myxococcales bacterium]